MYKKCEENQFGQNLRRNYKCWYNSYIYELRQMMKVKSAINDKPHDEVHEEKTE